MITLFQTDILRQSVHLFHRHFDVLSPAAIFEYPDGAVDAVRQTVLVVAFTTEVAETTRPGEGEFS